MKQLLTLLSIAFLFVGAMSFQSCKKCTTCSYTYQVAGQPIATYTYPEVCGNSGDIDNAQNTCANAAAIYGNTCNCTN